MVSKESHAESFLGREIIHQYWFPWKKFTLTNAFYLQLLSQKLTLFTESPSYIYIYIYMCVCVCVFAFHIALLPLEKVWIQLFSTHPDMDK